MLRKYYFFLPLIAVLIFGVINPGLSKQNESIESATAKFENYINEELARQNIVGLSVAFNYHGYEWSKGFGWADLENNVPATALSSYRMASISKPMTAVGILVLVSQGKIHLDDTVQKYVPYFPLKKWPVTIRQLLGHLGGISHYRNYQQESLTTRQMNTEEAIALFKDWDLLHQPGSKYQYTTYGFNLLGAAIEGASGKPYADFMREQVWGPLKMNHTGIDYLYKLIPNRVRGYRKVDGEIQNTDPVNTSLKIPGGGTRSTVIDMLNFARGIGSGQLLSKEYTDSMWTSMIVSDGHKTGYGMGWATSTFNGHFTVSHSGGQEGTRTYLLYMPVLDLTVAVASNFEASNPAQYAYHLVCNLLDYPTERPPLYTGQWQDDIRLRALSLCYEDGSGYLERYGTVCGEEPDQLAAAFRYLNQFAGGNDPLHSQHQLADSLVNDGAHPLSGWAYATVGSHIAAALKSNSTDDVLKTQRIYGPLSFFTNYIELYNGNPDSNQYIHLAAEYEKKIHFWYKHWKATWNPERPPLRIRKESDPVLLEEQLAGEFSGHPVYPDYSAKFGEVIRECIQRDSIGQAFSFARVSYKLYPRSDMALSQLGLLNLIATDQEKGRQLIKQAAELNPGGYTSAGNLNNIAYEMAGLKKIDAGMRILHIAVELHPKEANLYDSSAEFYLMKGDTTQAISLYKKALEVRPEFENAKRMLELISK